MKLDKNGKVILPPPLYTLDDFDDLRDNIRDENPDIVLRGIIGIRLLLTEDDPPIDYIANTGVIPELLALTHYQTIPQIQT